MNDPRFAVVGHPNKGKSSIVSTLCEDDSVRISPTPGTTTRVRAFPMSVDGELLYTLIDTPGFQRARRALAWLDAQGRPASERPQLIREFIDTHQDNEQFRDEVEILRPIADGAGILYVIDGSQRYSGEYEAEMEILRYTGQPSMALINRIGSSDHSAEWLPALEQYFRVVRRFDPYTAQFTRRLEVLKAFGELRLEWRAPLERAARALTQERIQRRHRSAHVIAALLYDVLSHRDERPLAAEIDVESQKKDGLNRLTDTVRQYEEAARTAVEEIFGFHQLAVSTHPMALLSEDLFSDHSLKVWGLTTSQLVGTGAIGGAAIGTGVDAALGGASLFTGALVGAVVGGASGLVGHRQLAEVKILGASMGTDILQIGPIVNPNIPYALLARALYHYHEVTERTHAHREPLTLEEATERFGAQQLPASSRKQLEKQFTAIRRRAANLRRSVTTQALASIIEKLLADGEALNS